MKFKIIIKRRKASKMSLKIISKNNLFFVIIFIYKTVYKIIY